MSAASLFLILFMYYGGIETAGSFIEYSSLKEVFRSALAVALAAAFAGIVYFLFGKNTPDTLKFMTVPLTFIVSGYAVSNFFGLSAVKVIFSSFGGIMIFFLPDAAGGFFAGLAAGCAGFIISCVILYQVFKDTKKIAAGALPAVLIIASIISMTIELFLK